MPSNPVLRLVRRFWRSSPMVIFFWLYLIPSDGAMSAWYVTPTGAGNQNGRSWANAFNSIELALNWVQPGDTIYLGDGDYYESLVTRLHGEAGAPITIRGGANAVLRGAGDDRIFRIYHDYYVLDGWTINGYDGAGNSASDYRDTLLYVHGQAFAYGGEVQRGPRGLEVRNMHFLNAGGECIHLRYFVTLANIHDNTIHNCGIYAFVFNLGGKTGEGIYIGTAAAQWSDGKNPTDDPDATSNNHIHHNVINTQGNECVEVKEGGTGNLIEANVCTGSQDVESAGLGARGDANTFRDNTTYGHAGSGIRFGGHLVNGHPYGVGNAAYRNTMYDNAASGINFESSPQATLCENTFTGPDGQTQTPIASGPYATDYGTQVSAPCDDTVEPIATPTSPATDVPTPLSTVTATAEPNTPTPTPGVPSESQGIYLPLIRN